MGGRAPGLLHARVLLFAGMHDKSSTSHAPSPLAHTPSLAPSRTSATCSLPPCWVRGMKGGRCAGRFSSACSSA